MTVCPSSIRNHCVVGNIQGRLGAKDPSHLSFYLTIGLASEVQA